MSDDEDDEVKEVSLMMHLLRCTHPLPLIPSLDASARVRPGVHAYSVASVLCPNIMCGCASASAPLVFEETTEAHGARVFVSDHLPQAMIVAERRVKDQAKER